MSSAAHTGAAAKAIRAGVQLTGALHVNAAQQKDSREIKREDTHTTEKRRIHEMSFHSKTLHKPMLLEAGRHKTKELKCQKKSQETHIQKEPNTK